MSEVIREPVAGRRPARTAGHRRRLNTPTSPTWQGLAACLSYVAMGLSLWLSSSPSYGSSSPPSTGKPPSRPRFPGIGI